MSASTEVSSRPILFSGPMVRAILEGRKTQTRRILKGEWKLDGDESGCGWEPPACPHGTVGDRLWVREAWRPVCSFDPSPETGADYRADYHTGIEKRDGDDKWRPSIHMPRWASRITLEITGVRVERLQEISEKDARSEGVDTMRDMRFAAALGNLHSGACRLNFIDLWQSINGPESWSANPWVWVIEFRRVEQC